MNLTITLDLDMNGEVMFQAVVVNSTQWTRFGLTLMAPYKRPDLTLENWKQCLPLRLNS